MTLAERKAKLRNPEWLMGLKTDTTFFAGVGTLDKQAGNQAEAERIVKAAKHLGYTPSMHDFYCPALARCCGDPEAFVPHTGGRSYVKRLCEQRGVSCEGAVEYTAPRSEHAQPYVTDSDDE